MEIGGHTESHPFLTDVDDTRLKNEINRGKETIEKNLGESIYSFA